MNGPSRGGVVLVAALAAVSLLAVTAFSETPEVGKLPTVTTELQELEASAGEADEEVVLLVVLGVQGGDRIAREVRAEQGGRSQELVAEIRDVHTQLYPRPGPLPDAEERAVYDSWPRQLPAEKNSRLRQLNEELDTENARLGLEITGRLREAFAPSQTEVAAFIESLGGEVRSKLSSFNALIATLQVSRVEELAAHPLVASLDVSSPGEPMLDVNMGTLAADAFWTNDPWVDGAPYDIAVVDSGVSTGHTYLSSHTFVVNDASVGVDHGTKVTGAYASTHPTYEGLSPGVDKIFVDVADDEAAGMEAFDWVVSYTGDRAEVLNYSWGHGYASTLPQPDYEPIEAFVDALVSTHDVVFVQGAGNRAWDGSLCKIERPGKAFNVLTVGNMREQETEDRSDDVRSPSASANGPTPGGRFKPDLIAPGYRTMTTGGSNAYPLMVEEGGTSLATPKVGAGALLLRSTGMSSSKAIRATLINTADAWSRNGTTTTSDDGEVAGSHWDPVYGWGYLDLWHAWFHAFDYFVDEVTPFGTPGSHQFYAGYLYANEKATLVWDKRVGWNGADYPTTEYDLTPLQMQLWDEDTATTWPEDWTLSALGTVRQVAGDYNGWKVIHVFAFSEEIDGADSEEFAVALAEGWERRAGPKLSSMEVVEFTATSCGEVFDVGVRAENVGDIWAHNVELLLEVPAGWTVVGGDNPAELGSVGDGAFTQSATWQVQAPAGPYGPFDLDITSSTRSFGFEWSWQAALEVEIPERPANNACGGAVLVPNTPGIYVFAGDTSAACHNYNGLECTGVPSNGRDVVFQITLKDATMVCAQLLSGAVDGSIYLTRDYGIGAECVGGSDRPGTGLGEGFCSPLYPSGWEDFFLVVDSRDSMDGGSFLLGVEIKAGLIFADGFESGNVAAW